MFTYTDPTPRIVRDYEKYIYRQLKRGASRQELNVSWLKKNELDMKRHVNELRDNIRTNWATTGQELSRELRQLQFWPATPRPESPARPPAAAPQATQSTNGTAAAGTASPRSPTSATAAVSNNVNDFITGYTLGLIGGVRSWVSNDEVLTTSLCLLVGREMSTAV